MLAVMVTAGKRKENPPRQKFIPRLVDALAGTIKGM